VIAVIDNGMFGTIRMHQEREYPTRVHGTELKNPDFAAYARACGADGYSVETLEEFERAFSAALASNRPSVIDAKITRLALPHYSPSPAGTIAGVLEMIEARFRGAS
jgi:acetolactate synthase I/II/III large subunit